MKTVVLKNGMGSQTCHSFVNEINDIFNKQNSVKRGQRDSISKFQKPFCNWHIFFFNSKITTIENPLNFCQVISIT